MESVKQSNVVLGPNAYTSMNVNPPLRLDVLKSRFDKSTNYWGRSLAKYKKDTKAIFVLYENYKFVKTELTVILQHLVEIDMFKSVLAVHFMPNPNFISLEFDSQEDVIRFMDLSFIINGLQVKFISGEEEIKSVNIIIDKLPLDIIRSEIPNILQQWGKVINIKTDTLVRPDGKVITIGQSVIEFLINSYSKLEDLPYFVRVLGVKVFLHIRGRKKICFKCSSFDHLVADCSLRYCQKCRGMRPLSHKCLLSFAQIIKSPEQVRQDLEAVIFDDENLSNLSLIVPAEPVNIREVILSSVEAFPPLESAPCLMDLSVDQLPDIGPEFKIDAVVPPTSAAEVGSLPAVSMSIDVVSNKRSFAASELHVSESQSSGDGEGGDATEENIGATAKRKARESRRKMSESESPPSQLRKSYELRSLFAVNSNKDIRSSSPPKLLSNVLSASISAVDDSIVDKASFSCDTVP